jgi:hypothetical protein
MKTLLFVLLLIPSLIFGQVSNWRTNPPQQSTPQTRVEVPRVQQNTTQTNDVSRWRNNSPKQSQQDPRGADLINLVIIGVIGDGTNHFHTYGMMILGGGKEV